MPRELRQDKPFRSCQYVRQHVSAWLTSRAQYGGNLTHFGGLSPCGDARLDLAPLPIQRPPTSEAAPLQAQIPRDPLRPTTIIAGLNGFRVLFFALLALCWWKICWNLQLFRRATVANQVTQGGLRKIPIVVYTVWRCDQKKTVRTPTLQPVCLVAMACLRKPPAHLSRQVQGFTLVVPGRSHAYEYLKATTTYSILQELRKFGVHQVCQRFDSTRESTSMRSALQTSRRASKPLSTNYTIRAYTDVQECGLPRKDSIRAVVHASYLRRCGTRGGATRPKPS